MTLDEINQQLAAIVNTNDPTFAPAAQYIQQIIQQATSGQMSSSEIQEVLADAQQQLSILQDMSQMSIKETLNTIITGLITIAVAVQ